MSFFHHLTQGALGMSNAPEEGSSEAADTEDSSDKENEKEDSKMMVRGEIEPIGRPHFVLVGILHKPLSSIRKVMMVSNASVSITAYISPSKTREAVAFHQHSMHSACVRPLLKNSPLHFTNTAKNSPMAEILSPDKHTTSFVHYHKKNFSAISSPTQNP